jgi:DNA-binding transcriptional ArsR family regulator
MNAIKDQFTETAGLVAESVRATILWTLMDGKAYTATELAFAVETSASNISMHLAKLVKADLLRVESQGRHRYYAFSGEKVAYAMEALAGLMPRASLKSAPADDIIPAVQKARTCYDHLAGRTGVAVTDALLKQKIIFHTSGNFELTSRGNKWFDELGIDIGELQKQRRSFLRPCLDWSERRYHMAGALAAALLDKFLAEDWMRKTKNSRALVVTAKGQKLLYEKIKLTV